MPPARLSTMSLADASLRDLPDSPLATDVRAGRAPATGVGGLQVDIEDLQQALATAPEGQRAALEGLVGDLRRLDLGRAVDASGAVAVGLPLAAGDALLAVRRYPFRTTQLPGSAPAWSTGLAAAERIGPVLDRSGVPVWVDVFRRVRQLRFVPAPGAEPFLTVPVRQAPIVLGGGTLRAGDPLRVTAGSAWFATGLVSAAPPGTWTGVRITGGALRFSADVVLGDEQVVVPPGVTVEVRLEFDPPVAAEPPAGAELAAATVTMPTGLDLDLRPTGSTISVRGSASLTAWGATVGLAPATSPAQLRPELHRLAVPLTPDVGTLTTAASASELFDVTGSAPVSGAALALPAAPIASGDLGEAAGVGALLLDLGPGLSATWAGEEPAAPLGGAVLLLDSSRLSLTAHRVRGTGRPWRPALPHLRRPAEVAATRRSGHPVQVLSTTDGESVALSATASLRAGSPVDVGGDRWSVRLPAATLVHGTDSAGVHTLTLAGSTAAEAPATAPRPRAYALRNAVLSVSAPHTAGVQARVEGAALAEGTLLAAYHLQGVLPSLPDPYATNLPLSRRFGAGDRGTVVTALRFGPAGERLDVVLPRDLQLDVPGPGGEAASAIPESRDDPGGLARKAVGPALDFERDPKVVLLDVSTAASRFGVAVRPPFRGDGLRSTVSGGGSPSASAAVRDLDLSVDGRFLVLLTLPAVQWEPVRAEPGPEPFPDEVRFATSGLPTVIDVPSVELVAVDPLAAYRTVRDTAARPGALPARARFTLPFGMVAQAHLAPPGPAGRGVRVEEVRPRSDDLEGAHQLRLEAVDPTLPPGETPALPGFVAQLPVALPTDGSGPRSVLGLSATMIVNGALGAGSPAALVPVTRIDLSGHGESLFSRWANPDDPETGVAKAEFSVAGGRTAHEVVQVKSILCPYMVPVVRTLTLERKGNAVVTRRDSGWVAVRDGTYRASAGSPVVTHPGVVLRITRVTGIRETGTTVSAGGGLFVAAYFDGDLVLDGAAAPVPVHRQLGYVKLSIPPLDPAMYAALIRTAGPMGGPLDTTISVGGGAHRMRLHRVGVDVAGTEFAMAAWGSPVFPGGGEWSILESEDPAEAPVLVTADRGVPLVRQGPAGAPTSAPYRFADPGDLFDVASPARDYGLLHAMGTQRAYFRRPRVEPTAPDRMVSTERPVVADPMLLATGLGPFPRQADAIAMPPSAWALEARADGTWRLDAPPTFPAALPRRTLRAAGAVRADMDYSAASVTYTLDTSDAVPWRFRLEHAVRVLAHSAMGDLVTTVVDVDGEAGRATRFAEPRMQLGGPFSIVEDLLTVLADLGIVAEPDVRMTNGWALKVGLNVPFVDARGDDLKVIPGEPLPTIKFADTGLKFEQVIAFDDAEASMELGGTPMFAIKAVPGLYVVAIIKFSLKVSTKTGTVYGVLLGVGIAYTLEAGPFELKGLFALTFFAVFGDSVLGYGIGFVVKLAAELPPIVSIELSLEGKLARVTAAQGTPTETVFQVGKLTFAIEVSVFLVFSISLEVETKKVEVLRGPLPVTAVPDVL